MHQGGDSAGKGQIGGPSFWLSACSHPALAGWHSSHQAWRCWHDTSREAYDPPSVVEMSGHRAVGHGQLCDVMKYPWQWQSIGFQDHDWLAPSIMKQPHGNPWGNRPLGCHLVAHDFPPIPRQERSWQRICCLPDGEPRSDAAWQSLKEFPASWTITEPTTIICDAGYVMIGYPEITCQGGLGSIIDITACEAPVDATGAKIARDDALLATALLPGLSDRLLMHSVGERSRKVVPQSWTWQPEWIRSLRYLVLTIIPGDQPLTLALPKWREASYPLPLTTAIQLPENRPWQHMITVNRRTAAACAHETFFDCPSWEQAQFLVIVAFKPGIIIWWAMMIVWR